jgi:glutaredoxin
VEFRDAITRAGYNSVMTKVIIYSRPGCHLCEEAKAAMRQADWAGQDPPEYTLEEINIETDPELLARYRHDIPVVTINDVEVFRHRVNSEEFAVELLRLERTQELE